MDSFIQNIAHAFGLKCKGMSRERFGFLCMTGQGLVLIQKLPKSQLAAELSQNILFQHEVKEYLSNNGFGETDKFFLTDKGLPYHKAGEEIFVATIAFDAPRADFAKRADFLAIVTKLGLMHKILADADFESRPKKRHESNDDQKAVEILASYRKKIMKAGKFSDFDMLFLKAFEMYEPKMTAWTVLPKDKLGHNKYVCHNLLKEENIYMGANADEGPIFTNFGMAAYGHYLHDLVYIVKRYLKAGPKGDLPLNEILNAYQTHHPMEDFDFDFFIAMLAYPDKFVKLAKDYYSKKRSFAPKTYLTRMEEVFARGNALEEFLRNSSINN